MRKDAKDWPIKAEMVEFRVVKKKPDPFKITPNIRIHIEQVVGNLKTKYRFRSSSS